LRATHADAEKQPKTQSERGKIFARPEVAVNIHSFYPMSIASQAIKFDCKAGAHTPHALPRRHRSFNHESCQTRPESNVEFVLEPHAPRLWRVQVGRHEETLGCEWIPGFGIEPEFPRDTRAVAKFLKTL
jgi:hypothetical protein